MSETMKSEMVAVRVAVDEKYPAFYVTRPHSDLPADVEIPVALFEELKRCEDAMDDAEQAIARWILENAPGSSESVRGDCRRIL